MGGTVFGNAGAETNNFGVVETTFGQPPRTARQKKQLTPTFVTHSANPIDDDSALSNPSAPFGGPSHTVAAVDAGAHFGGFGGAAKPLASALESRLNGGRGKGGIKSRLGRPMDQTIEDDSSTANLRSMGRPRRQTPVIQTDGSSQQQEPEALPSNRARKKQQRGAPQSSPRQSPPHGSPAHSPTAMPSIGSDANKAELSSATDLDGLCVDMCSPAERELHIRVDELSVFEKCYPDQPGQERHLIIKRFQRSSADHKLDIPSEVRPPGVLRATQLYIEQAIMDLDKAGPDPRFNPPRVPDMIELYNFCWDRCRMIRKDFVLQNYRGAGGRVNPIVLDVHERIARYHILSEHELCEVPSFVAQQNMEQLGQTLKSLNELYDESRKLADPAYLSPFEAEFRAYFILCTLDNGRGLDVLKFVKGLSTQIRETAQIKFAMRVFVARHTQDYFQFFSLLREATFLQSCLLFRYIPSMRSLALERMNRAYRNQPFQLIDIVDMLCFDDIEHAETVCAHHGLDISADDDAVESIVVNFGGEFETDVQLRKNKNPLPVRFSKVYIGQKQGEYLRRDICRGITEYAAEDYPPLSQLIEATEQEERNRLYPTHPMYEDDFSAFAVYMRDPFDNPNDDGGSGATKHTGGTKSDWIEVDEPPSDDLELISARKAQIEQERQLALQKLQQLERAKQEREARARQKEQEEQERLQREADARAKVAAAAREQERLLLAKLDEEKKKLKEREALEAEKRRQVEEAKRAAQVAEELERRKQAAARQREEDERRQRELLARQQALEREAALAAERKRREELIAEQARLKRIAEEEEKRRVQQALEQARRKQERQAEKRRLAVLKLRFHQWKEYTLRSKMIPSGVRLEHYSLLDQSQRKPVNTIEWLFSGDRAAADRIGLTRPQLRQDTNPSVSSEVLKRLWQPIDICSIVGPKIAANGRADFGWKLVIADLLDLGVSSFGSWCAVKLGMSSAALDEDVRVSTVHQVQTSEGGAMVCTRYVDANFSLSLSSTGQRRKLAGTSAILLPFDLSEALKPNAVNDWENRINRIIMHLHPASRVSVVVLGYCASGCCRVGDAIAVVERVIRRVQSRFDGNVVYVDGELLVEDDSNDGFDAKLSQVLLTLAEHTSPPPTRLITTDFSSLIELSVNRAFNCSSSTLSSLQENLQRELWELRKALTSPLLAELDLPVPELDQYLETPAYNWNGRDAVRSREEVMNTLLSSRAAHVPPETSPSKLCETSFKVLSDLIDTLFRENRDRQSHRVSLNELKSALYKILLPLHEDISRRGSAFVHHGDITTLIPWRHLLQQIYDAFAEEVDTTLLYIPADLEILKPVEPSPEIVTQSWKELKRSNHLESSSKLEDQLAMKRASEPEEVASSRYTNQLKRLCTEISANRAASQSFQHFLRRELHRWEPESTL
ncbi:hypothetical protein PINS_up003171 [Pythium insidiosum]|nr:hypothetical protein PINS_up003171 [Pythium insidiosum]